MSRKMLSRESKARPASEASLWMGPLVILAGAAMLVLLAGGVKPGSSHLPRRPAINALLSLVVVGFGAKMTADGMKASRESARRWQSVQRGPRPAWAVDYPWNTVEASDGSAAGATRSLGIGLATGVVLAPYAEVVFFYKDATATAKALMVIAILVAAAFLGHGLYLLARRLQFGRSTLRFAEFPYALGETLEAEFRTSVNVRAFDSLLVTLRCIEEQRSEIGDGDLETWEIWKSEQLVPRPMVPVLLKFNLPNDPALASHLAADLPRYWELEVTCERPGIDFCARFLVPVYAAAPAVVDVKPR